MIAAASFVALIFIVSFSCPVISGTTYADESHCYKHSAYFLYLVHNSVISSWTLIIFQDYVQIARATQFAVFQKHDILRDKYSLHWTKKSIWVNFATRSCTCKLKYFLKRFFLKTYMTFSFIIFVFVF